MICKEKTMDARSAMTDSRDQLLNRTAVRADRLASYQRPQSTPVLTSTTNSATDVGHFCRSRDGGICHHKMMTKTKDADESKQYKGGMLELMFPTAVDVGQAT